MLALNNLWFRYTKNTPILKGISLTVQKGEIVSILGPSGSGKSTLLSVIAGLEAIESGSITLKEKDITQLVCEKRNIGMVFQDYALFPHLTVEKNIAFACKNKKDPFIHEMIQLVRLSDYTKRYPHELSGGQQQRVAIARSLLAKPDVLLLDEPFSNLDSLLRQEIRDEIKRILNHLNITTILVTHDIQDAQFLSNRIVYLEGGKIIKEETVKESS